MGEREREKQKEILFSNKQDKAHLAMDNHEQDDQFGEGLIASVKGIEAAEARVNRLFWLYL